MTVAPENNDVAAEEVAGLREWVRPAIQQLAAGTAEDFSGPATDSITNPS